MYIYRQDFDVFYASIYYEMGCAFVQDLKTRSYRVYLPSVGSCLGSSVI